MDLTYSMPTKIFFGKQAVSKNKKVFTEYGKKALIITGKCSAKKTGALLDVTASLDENNIKYAVYDNIEENPCTKTIEEAARFGKDEKVEFIIGIGGGSPLDAAKAIGIMIKNPYLTEKTLFTDKKLESIPILAVPTTSGTGSETTPYAILTDHKAKTKRNLGQKVFCSAAFLDAAYTQDMPYALTVNTALDAMTHLIEGYLNTNATIFSDMIAEKGLMLWGSCLPQLVNGSFDVETREKLMLASTLAGMLIANTGTSLPHGMGYPLTYFKHVPHGLANAVLFRAYINCFKDRSKLEKVYYFMGLTSKTAFEEILSKLVHLKLDISEDEIETWSKAMCQNAAKLKNHPEQVSYETVYSIYSDSLKMTKN